MEYLLEIMLLKLIEFIGIPGAGKTTIVKGAIASMKRPDLNIIEHDDIIPLKGKRQLNRIQQGLCVILYLVRKPMLLKLFLRREKPEKTHNPEFLLRSTIRLVNISHRLSLYTPVKGTCVLDQGPLQALSAWMLAGGRLTKTELTDLIFELYPHGLPETVIWVQIPPKLAAKRMMQRLENNGNRTNLDHLKHGEKVLFLRKTNTHLQKLWCLLNDLQVNVIVLRGDNFLEKNTPIVTRLLWNSLEKRER